ncbi:ATP-binding protein [Parabacteroides sp. FAFU027]|uniref:sensor histidine kinase n=1 Tax=Parabacteroides sp. FAFU027 TaxID=2922715 RepID=UPI001FAEE247|nr:ATP-binding protein [Parabacteroides sp. FAFU027]
MKPFFKKNSMRVPFHKRLFITIFSLFFLFVIIVSVFQYQREKYFREQMLSTTLTKYNTLIMYEIQKNGISNAAFNEIHRFIDLSEIRITVIDLKGKVLFDSERHDFFNMSNHLNRPEIIAARQKGYGYAIRYSESVDRDFFYSAQKYGNLYIRTALPYNTQTVQLLRPDNQFIYFLVILFLLMVLTLFRFSHVLGKNISHLRDFAVSAEKNELRENMFSFSNDDIGEISEKLVKIYHRLVRTKTALSIEREKLFMHFRFSREGLAIFSKEKKEILTNSLFIQHINLISDFPLENAEQVFQLKEFTPICDFLDASLSLRQKREEVVSKKVKIMKGGKSFEIDCVIFEDKTFEISIFNNTQQEEENRLKRQLTQNISHELKTPVSSIQGYMETILSMPDLDPAKRQLFLERCYAQSKRLSYLLSDISMLNRMDEANTLFDIEHVEVSRIVHDIHNEIQLELDKKNISVEFKNWPEKIFIEGNSSLVYSIFRNLFDNASTYAGENVKITISCYRQDAEYYYFSFADTGTGVAEEHLNRLFERFYRVDKGRSRKIGGTGLGLAIVKNAVLFHKGEISAKNRPEGGLEFMFKLKKKLA